MNTSNPTNSPAASCGRHVTVYGPISDSVRINGINTILALYVGISSQDIGTVNIVWKKVSKESFYLTIILHSFLNKFETCLFFSYFMVAYFCLLHAKQKHLSCLTYGGVPKKWRDNVGTRNLPLNKILLISVVFLSSSWNMSFSFPQKIEVSTLRVLPQRYLSL